MVERKVAEHLVQAVQVAAETQAQQVVIMAAQQEAQIQVAGAAVRLIWRLRQRQVVKVVQVLLFCQC